MTVHILCQCKQNWHQKALHNVPGCAQPGIQKLNIAEYMLDMQLNMLFKKLQISSHLTWKCLKFVCCT